MKYTIYQSQEFGKWLHNQSLKTQLIITARLERLQNEGPWGISKKIDNIFELKWKSGLRVYLAVTEQNFLVILLGGNKNGQSKDIKKAKKIYSKFY